MPGLWDEAGHEHVGRADCAGVTPGVEDAVKVGVAVDGACAPVALSHLPVVPIDPKAVLWAVEKMIEL